MTHNLAGKRRLCRDTCSDFGYPKSGAVVLFLRMLRCHLSMLALSVQRFPEN
jgi:hypothetical protein